MLRECGEMCDANNSVMIKAVIAAVKTNGLMSVPCDSRMTSFAVIYWKCHLQMTGAAKFALQYVIHGKMCGTFLLNVENIGMTVVAFKPTQMCLMGKNCRRDSAPGGLKIQILVKGDIPGFCL